MKTFVIGKAKVVGQSDCVRLTPAQYAAAKVVEALKLSPLDLNDLLVQIGHELVPAAPVPSNEHRPDLDGETWQQIADMGPIALRQYKITAIKRLRETDPMYSDLFEAKHAVEKYMDEHGI